METHPINSDRRAFLAGTLGVLGAAVAGCSTQVGNVNKSSPTTSSESTPTVASSEPRAATTSPRPRAQAPTAKKPASASTMIARATVPVLCYHQLRDWNSKDTEYDRMNLVCPPRYFRAQLDALADAGWNTINPDQYLKHITSGAALPDKPVMLTFDDASAGHATEGLSQLADRGMTGTFFVMTVVLGKPKWMSTSDIKRLARAGMTIGSHTWDHQAVTDLSGRDWKVQLEQTRDMLRQASGQPVDHFAYPYGMVSAKAFPRLQDAGYKTAFQLEATKLDPGAPLYTLRRSIAVSTWSGASLIKYLTKHRP